MDSTEKKRHKEWLERLEFYAKGITHAQKKELIDFVEYKVWQSNREKFQSLK